MRGLSAAPNLFHGRRVRQADRYRFYQKRIRQPSFRRELAQLQSRLETATAALDQKRVDFENEARVALEALQARCLAAAGFLVALSCHLVCFLYYLFLVGSCWLVLVGGFLLVSTSGSNTNQVVLVAVQTPSGTNGDLGKSRNMGDRIILISI